MKQTKFQIKKVKEVIIQITIQMKSMIQEATLLVITGDPLSLNIQIMRVIKMKSYHFLNSQKKLKYRLIIMYISFLKI